MKDRPAAMASPSGASSLRRHVLRALGLALLAHILYIHTLDAPKSIYHCPLDRHGLAHQWSDENCYWSGSYVEAREKFVTLGNTMKEQVLAADREGRRSEVVDVQSISYDMAAEDFPDHIRTLEVMGVTASQSIVPGSDTIDVLLLTMRTPANKADREHIDIIHSSGTHGVEGYLGSAVQIRFLHELFLQNEAHLANEKGSIPPSSENDGTRKVLLIHAVNPYGMRHHRRTNEHNVDLNRNALGEDVWDEVRKRDPNFVGYVAMDAMLNPFSPLDEDGTVFSWVETARRGGYDGDIARLKQRDDEVNKAADGRANGGEKYAIPSIEESANTAGSWIEEKTATLHVVACCIYKVVTMGFTNAKRGLVTQQYHKQSGISYGGGAHAPVEERTNKWENSIHALRHAIVSFASLQFTSSSSSDKAIWIDAHTGLGRYGEYSVLMKDDRVGAWGESTSSSESSTKGRAWIATFQSLLARSNLGYGHSYDPGVSAGYDQSIGFVTGDVLCPPPHCLGMNQEFGTRAGIAIATALVMENLGHNAGRRRYNHLTSWAFYPQRLSWRRKALRGGIDLLHAALDF